MVLSSCERLVATRSNGMLKIEFLQNEATTY